MKRKLAVAIIAVETGALLLIGIYAALGWYAERQYDRTLAAVTDALTVFDEVRHTSGADGEGRLSMSSEYRPGEHQSHWQYALCDSTASSQDGGNTPWSRVSVTVTSGRVIWPSSSVTMMVSDNGRAERFIESAKGRLRPGTFILLEVGQGQAEDVLRLMSGAGWIKMSSIPDLAGIPRVATATAS